MHVREAKVAALVAIRQSFVIDTQQVKHGRVHVVDVYRVFDDVVTEIVRLSKGDAGLDAAPQPSAIF